MRTSLRKGQRRTRQAESFEDAIRELDEARKDAIDDLQYDNRKAFQWKEEQIGRGLKTVLLDFFDDVADERRALWIAKTKTLGTLEKKYKRYRSWKATRTLSGVDIATCIAGFLDEPSDMHAFASAIRADGHWPLLHKFVKNRINGGQSLNIDPDVVLDLLDTWIYRHEATVDLSERERVLGPVVMTLNEGAGNRIPHSMWNVILTGLKFGGSPWFREYLKAPLEKRSKWFRPYWFTYKQDRSNILSRYGDSNGWHDPVIANLATYMQDVLRRSQS